MLGAIANSLAIIVGCLIGLCIKKGVPQRLSDTIMNGMSLCVIYIGIAGSLKGIDTMVIIISMAIGALIGELLNIDKALNKLGDYLERKFNKNKNEVSIAQGFVSASLIYCVGAMAVVGALNSGLMGNNEMLFTKSILDGISAIIFSASLGIGVMFSAVPVFLYEGCIALCAGLLSVYLNDTVIANMTCVGSLLIIALGLNMLKATNIKVANLLPAIFIPIFFGIIGMM